MDLLACFLALSCLVVSRDCSLPAAELVSSAQVGQSNPMFCRRTVINAGPDFMITLATSSRKMELVVFCRRVRGLGGGGRAAGD